MVHFMTPAAGVLVLRRGHVNHILDTLIFFNILFSTSEVDQTKSLVMVTKEGFSKFLNFKTP